MVKQILKKEYITNSEAYEILSSDTFDQNSPVVRKSIEFLAYSRKCDSAKSREVVKKLIELSLPEELAVMLVNILPREPTELRALLPPSFLSLPSETLEKAIEILKDCISD